MRRNRGSIGAAWLLAAFAAACEGQDPAPSVAPTGDAAAEDAAPPPDVGVPDVALDSADAEAPSDLMPPPPGEDTAPVEPLPPGVRNACGGLAPLRATPATECGRCGQGRWICQGTDEITCVGDTPLNACGGCDLLDARPGEPCGPCGGTWVCRERTGTLVCEGSQPRNACGGCGTLAGEPNFGCFGGIYVCDGPNATACFENARNACGGVTVLAAPPGARCGPCGTGRTVCDGREATGCRDDEVGLNACGGCGRLAALPGPACGCGGTWRCDGSEGVVCEGDAGTNACGGCQPLAVQPGTPCEGGVQACDGPEGLRCVPADANTCGGTVPLAAAPGTPCGPCEDGIAVCASPDAVTCRGAQPRNACGSCGVLPGEPGALCGTDRRWVCVGGDLVCSSPPQRNACGGVAELRADPGARCGSCDGGIYLCTSLEDVACFGARSRPRNLCGGCETLPVGANPGSACGVCLSGRWTCQGLDAITCEGEEPALLRTFYADRDGDGWGNAGETREACALPFGFVTRPGDCDDRNPAIYPAAPERCDGLDNDCNGAVDEGFLYYRDADQDGWGVDGETDIRCGDRTGWAPRPGDCDDADNRVFPGQTRFFDRARSDGTWDFNCDDDLELRDTAWGRCNANDLATCSIRFPIGGFSEGWNSPVPPACGRLLPWVIGCSVEGGICTPETENRRQACR